MTISEEFISEDEQGFEEESSYPVAFGITFTPQVTGIALAALGLVGAAYILMTFVMPAYDQYKTLKAEEQEKLDQVQLQQSGALDQKLLTREGDLIRTQDLKAQVLSLFSNERTLDTLLLDLSRFFAARNVTLLKFQPQGEVTIVNDNSLGASVNNMLKRQSIAVEMEGTFQQTQAVIRDLERLQPLLLVKNLNSQLSEESISVLVVNSGGSTQVIPQANEELTTNFIMDVILPLNPEEAAQFAPQAEQEGQ